MSNRSRGDAATYRRADSRYNTLRRESRRFLMQRWPDLKDAKAEGYAMARKEAMDFLARNARETEYRDLLEADDELFKLQEEGR